jgi:hypothetical protein
MRFLLDEDVSYRVCAPLMAAGHDAVLSSAPHPAPASGCSETPLFRAELSGLVA